MYYNNSLHVSLLSRLFNFQLTGSGAAEIGLTKQRQNLDKGWSDIHWGFTKSSLVPRFCNRLQMCIRHWWHQSLITESNYKEFRRNKENLKQRANYAAWLKIAAPAENCGPNYEVTPRHEIQGCLCFVIVSSKWRTLLLSSDSVLMSNINSTLHS